MEIIFWIAILTAALFVTYRTMDSAFRAAESVTGMMREQYTKPENNRRASDR